MFHNYHDFDLKGFYDAKQYCVCDKWFSDTKKRK